MTPCIGLFPGTLNLRGQWIEVDIVQSYSTHTWDLWINGEVVKTNLKFKDSALSELSQIYLKNGGVGSLYFDDLNVSGN